MHAAPAAGAMAPPQPKSHIMVIAEQFQNDVINWLLRLQHDATSKKIIYDFLAKSDKTKLKKNDNCLELGALPFSILRMEKPDGKIIFFLIGRETIGTPGANGRIKIAMRLSFLGTDFIVHTHLFVALKIIRTQEMGVLGEPILTECARTFYSEIYPEVYAVARRETQSQKSRYRGHENEYRDTMVAELACGNKIYISIPLFNAIDLFDYFNNNYASLPDTTFFSILLGVLNEIGKLHARGVVHRDIKFENILINAETLRIDLIDHDACALQDSDVKLAGTPNYINPYFVEICADNGNIETVSCYRDLYAFARMVDMYINEFHLKNSLYEANLKNILRGIYQADPKVDTVQKIKDYLIKYCRAKPVLKVSGISNFGLKEENIVVVLKPGAENTPPNTPEGRKHTLYSPPPALTPKRLHLAP